MKSVKPATWARRRLCLALLVSLGLIGSANAKEPFEPGNLTRATDKDGLETLTTPALKTDELIARHIADHKPGHPLRIAEPFTLKADPDHVGTWKQEGNEAVWRLRVHSPNARSINFGFSSYRLPEGASLTLSSGNGKEAIRPFTAADNKPHGELWTPIVSGDEALLELRVPQALRKQVTLALGSINAGFVDFDAPFAAAKSGSCNVDVVCPAGDAWRNQIRSVGAYTIGGVDYCSGALVNNARGDGKPYFLTANHCLSTQSAANSTVVYWNYQNSFCRTPGSPASGQPGDGQRTQFNTGTLLRATRAASDFTLLEMANPLDPAHELYWSGVDASGTTPSSAIAIHHPGVEEKRISFENDPLTITGYGSGNPTGTTHWRVADWDLGTTEGGSSGSPLYSPEKRIVGQLHGGSAACGNNSPDWYGRVAVSWTAGGTAATQLKDWLDPDNTGALTIDGRDGTPFSLQVTPPVMGVCASDGPVDINIAIGQNDPLFTTPVGLSFSGLPTGANGALSNATVTPPGSSTLTISDLASATPGSYVVLIDALSGTDALNQSVPFELSAATPPVASPLAPANNSVGNSVSPILSWNTHPAAFEYQLEVATDANFGTIVSDQLVQGSSATLAGLNTNTWYYWRVTASNFCGTAEASAVYRFKTQPALGDCDDSAEAVYPFSEDFSGGLGDFSTAGSTGAQTWAISTTRPSLISGGNAALATNIATESDQRLTSPTIILPSDQNPITLKFQNWRSIENSGTNACFDGGILEIAADGGPFTQITGAALLNDPYRGSISTQYSNPLAGLNAWCEPTPGKPYADTLVDLSAYAGQSVQLRWRLGTDRSLSREGWYVDDIRVQACQNTPLEPEIFADSFEDTP